MNAGERSSWTTIPRLEACHPRFSSAVEVTGLQHFTCVGTLAVTPEAAGSSPVDPANYLAISYFHWPVDRVDLRPPSRRSNAFMCHTLGIPRKRSRLGLFRSGRWRYEAFPIRESLPPACHPPRVAAGICQALRLEVSTRSVDPKNLWKDALVVRPSTPSRGLSRRARRRCKCRSQPRGACLERA
jgi:hypothetical protein